MADTTRRPPSLSFESSVPSSSQLDEKTRPPASGHLTSIPRWSPYYSPRPFPPPQFIRHPAPIPILPIRSRSSPSHICRSVKPWLPLILYAITSLGFVVAVGFYRTEVFTYLDELSLWLRSDEHYGHAVLFVMIFITTIPPIPLYSTLIVLSGYTFGAWTGAIISYFAALTGALVVFIVSRTLARESIERWLTCCTSIKRVVRAIEKRPKLLFLIRLAPYPYNVMNCLLAASPTLTLHTYTVCTALSLFKVIIHTSLGASIHSFRDYHANPAPSTENGSTSGIVARIWTGVGIGLCVVILIYLSMVARRAVDDELDGISGESRAFLSADDLEGPASDSGSMTEVPFRSQQLIAADRD